jgi:mono/diheme cytochrome c family protein
MFRGIWIPLFPCVAALTSAAADEPRYRIGRLATAEDIRAAGISVAADGTGLPRGSGTAIQGRPIYEAACAACHGSRGEGNASYPALVGGRGTLENDQPILTVGSYWPYATTVWDYINRAMPYQNPGSLTTKQVYAVTAYVLFMNKIVGEREELNESTLSKVRMPNRDGFTSDPRPDVKSERSAVVAVPYAY